jgi:type I restriction enzyme R subunit
LNEINKKDLSEIDICDLYITPAIKDAGWEPFTQIRREVTLAPGPIIVRGDMSVRSNKKKKFADYILQWEPGVPLAIVEVQTLQNQMAAAVVEQALST